MKNLKISEDLSLPVDVVTQKLAWLGVTGGGKTYGAQKLAELMWDAGAQFIVLDPVGVWYGLRLARDGKSPSDVTIPIFGGLHGDLPLEHTAGALMADLVVDRGISAILDVSQFESDAQKARFGADFADRFFFRKKGAPSAVHLFIEESQEFVPQNTMKGEERMLHAFTRLQKLGRNFGIGSSYITQRPQEVNKKALNMAQTLFVFRTTGPQERKSIDGWIADKGLDQDIAGDLPKLKTGTCHVWSPEFLGVSELVRIREKRTFNASSTPEVGEVAKARHLAPIDLDKIRTEMAATIERAKESDPKELQKTIAQLRRELAAKPTAAAPCNHVVEISQLKEKLHRAAGECSFFRKVAQQVAERVNGEMAALLNNAPEQMTIDISRRAAQSGDVKTDFTSLHSVPPRREMPVVQRATPAPKASSGNGKAEGLTAPQQRILDALAWLESIRLTSPAKNVVAWMADASPTSSGFANNLGSLRSAGLIEYPRGGEVSLTEAGRAIAHTPEAPLTPDEMQRYVMAKVSLPQQRILDALIRRYPKPLAKDDLAAAAEASPTSSGYANNLGALRSLGLIEYPERGYVVAQPLLFLEERR